MSTQEHPTNAATHHKVTGRIEKSPLQPARPANAPDAFAAFDQWFQEYASAESSAVADGLAAEGAALARTRRAELSRLIETDPETALQLAVSARVRRAVPPVVRTLLEERVGGQGSLLVLARVPAPGEATTAPAIARLVTIHDRTYDAHVYGRRLTQVSAERIPMHGIAIGSAMALHEAPARLLEPGEAEELGLAQSIAGDRCPVSEAKGLPETAVQAGDEVRYLCEPGHLAAFNAALEAAEDTSASDGSGLAIAAARSDWTIGAKKLLLLRVAFADDPEPAMSVETAEALARRVEGFFLQNSYGALSIESTVSPVLVLPNDTSWYRALDEKRERLSRLLMHARDAAAAAGIVVSDYNLHLVHLKPGITTSSWGSIGANGAWLQNQDPITFCHEIGHNLGLYHAYSWLTKDGSVIGPGVLMEYENRFDVMGNGTSTNHHFGAYAKRSLNWLSAANVQEITDDGIYRLFPFDGASVEPNRAYALTLRKDAQRVYWIEARANLWSESPLARSVVLNWSPSMGSSGPILLDMIPGPGGGVYDAPLSLGETFQDPELGLIITPVRRADTTPESIDVLVAHVHSVTFEAESGVQAGERPITGNPRASQSASILLPKGNGGQINFAIAVPSAGEYALWGRFLAYQSDPVTVSVTFDDATAADVSTLSGLVPNEWRWVQFAAGAIPKKFRLTAGVHRLQIASPSAALEIDVLRLTDDPTATAPAAISPMPAQRIVAGRASEPIPFTLLDVDPASVRLSASSTDSSLTPNGGFRFDGSGVHRTLTIVPAANRLGTALVTVTAMRPGGRSIHASFSMTVIGVVQGLVDAAAPGETVNIPEGSYFESLVIEKDVILQGAGPEVTILENGLSLPVMTITNQATVIVRDLTLSRGRGGLVNHGTVSLVRTQVRGHQTWERGGGIVNGPAGWMLLENSTVSGNRCMALGGGGILNQGLLAVENSTISSNQVLGGLNEQGGGGILNEGSLTVHRATITLNSARRGPGIANIGEAELGSSIVAGNIDRDKVPLDLSGDFNSTGHNLIQRLEGANLLGDLTGNVIGKDPLLGPLQDNGGGMFTHALRVGSPAIDQGEAGGPGQEQRGFLRALDIPEVANATDGSDIGAVEFVPSGNRELRALAVVPHSPGKLAFRLVMTAQGDESTINLRLRYRTDWLSEPKLRAGIDARSANVTFETDDNEAGGLRIGLALPEGKTFGAGVRELAVVEFRSAREGSSAAPGGLEFAFGGGTSEVRNLTGDLLAAGYAGAGAAATAEATLVIEVNASGQVTLRLVGGTESSWAIESTSDFVTWEAVGWVPKGGSREPIVDAASKEPGHRFYRAVRD